MDRAPIRFGRCQIDVAARSLLRIGEPVEVQARVFDLLVFLIENRDRVVCTEELLDTVWSEVVVAPNTVSHAVYKARLAIGDDGHEQRSIATVRGRGFRFVAPLIGDGGGRPELSGPTFVGRQLELEHLRRALARAEAGRGGLVLLAGDPGIGKTRTAHEFMVRARGDGAHALLGRCIDADDAPPYWPWRQLARSFARGRTLDELRELVGGGAVDFARVEPRIAYILGRPPLPDLPPEQTRVRLFESAILALERAARARPLVLVLDDLHLADLPSLAFLGFLSRALAEAPILVVGTLRDAQLQRDPVRRALIVDAERRAGGETLQLEGLDPGELALLAEKRLGHTLGSASLAALCSRSGGNPFFAGELLHIAELRGSEALAPDDPRSCALPATVRATVAMQLEGLSARDRRILTLAAGLGNEFGIALLATASGAAPDEVLASVGAAAALHIVEAPTSRPNRYRFVHELLRESLYEDLELLERAHLHRRVAEALERDLDPDPAALASHWFEAVAVGGAERAVRHACEAARLCRSQLDFEQEARHLERALEAMALLPQHAAGRRCAMLIEAGTAVAEADPCGAEALLMRALDLARSLEPSACRPLLLAIVSAASNLRFASPELGGAVKEALGTPAGEEIAETAALLAAAGRGCLRGDPEVERETLRLPDLARASGEPRALGSALCAWHWASWKPGNSALRLEATREIERLGASAGRPALLEGRYLRALDALERADREELVKAMSDLRRGARETGQALSRWRSLACRSMIALIEGRFAAAERLAEDALAHGRRSEIHDFDVWTTHEAHQTRSAFLRGDAEALGDGRRRLAERSPERAEVQLSLASWHVELGDLAAARECLDACSTAELIPERQDVARTHLLARVCGPLGEPALCEAVREILLPWRGLNLVDASIACTFGPAARYLALASWGLGEWESSEECFVEAIALCERLSAPAELLPVRIDFARMLAARGRDRDLSAATAQLALARADAKRLRLPAMLGRLDRVEAGIRARG